VKLMLLMKGRPKQMLLMKRMPLREHIHGEDSEAFAPLLGATNACCWSDAPPLGATVAA
jgi:hypothetical protein